MLFLPMIDLGIAQTPMFGDGEPSGWTQFLPGYGAGRVLVDAAFSPSFHAWGELLLAVAWTAAGVVAVTLLLARMIGLSAAERTLRAGAISAGPRPS